MRRLRETDGTAVHRRAARYHIARCRAATGEVTQRLAEIMRELLATLVTAARAVEDAGDEAIERSAESDAAELAVENGVRDLDGVLAKLDRDESGLGAQAVVFPEGFGEVIVPEGEAQLATLALMYGRVERYQGRAAVAEAIGRIQQEEARFRAALAAEDAAEQKIDELDQRERAARRDIREQFEVAYGRLRELYKARPKLAERFFWNRVSGRRSPERAARADGAPGAAE
jgi:hypothetical protein